MPKKPPKKASDQSLKNMQRPAAELLFADELERLAKHDAERPKPPGWQLSPKAVLDFVLGNASLNIQPKFVGSRSFVECCIVALATNRGLMLIGVPGTAKSYLSELLAAAISGDSTLTVQGSSGTSEDHIKYSWNYAMLLSEGPSKNALVPAPIHRGMSEGKLVRFEEITRCPMEIQDALLSILSDRVLHIPEIKDDNRVLFATEGFNIIATANTLDKGVNEMSAALKRRFNFETVHPIPDVATELALIERETARLFEKAGIPMSLPRDKTEVLVTAFHELRNAKTREGKGMEPLSTVMSTAEAISVAYAAGIQAFYYDDGDLKARHLVSNMVGSAVKDSVEDIKKLRHYFRNVAGKRKGEWQAFAAAERHLLT